MELREAHRYQVTHNNTAKKISVGDIVIVADDKLPRGLWRLGKIEELITGADGMVRGARVRVYVDADKTSVIQRSVLKLYPLEFRPEVSDQNHEKNDVPENTQRRPKRQATARAEQRIRRWIAEEKTADELS